LALAGALTLAGCGAKDEHADEGDKHAEHAEGGHSEGEELTLSSEEAERAGVKVEEIKPQVLGETRRWRPSIASRLAKHMPHSSRPNPSFGSRRLTSSGLKNSRPTRSSRARISCVPGPTATRRPPRCARPGIACACSAATLERQAVAFPASP
jgi:hypothetical protein